MNQNKKDREERERKGERGRERKREREGGSKGECTGLRRGENLRMTEMRLESLNTEFNITE